MNKRSSGRESHIFSIFYPNLTTMISQDPKKTEYEIVDPTICHRITKILRLHTGESFILFDTELHTHCTIIKAEKKLLINCQKPVSNKILTPHITVLLPLLKREAFEEAIYSVVELGANVIQPIITQKTHQSWGNPKEYDRILRIIHAAAEQSKQYAIPKLAENPIPFHQLGVMLAAIDATIFFDPAGDRLIDIVKKIQYIENIVLIVGPEGDLTEEEKAALSTGETYFCQLTPTILRAQQAITVGLGSIRSLIPSKP